MNSIVQKGIISNGASEILVPTQSNFVIKKPGSYPKQFYEEIKDVPIPLPQFGGTSKISSYEDTFLFRSNRVDPSYRNGTTVRSSLLAPHQNNCLGLSNRLDKMINFNVTAPNILNMQPEIVKAIKNRVSARILYLGGQSTETYMKMYDE